MARWRTAANQIQPTQAGKPRKLKRVPSPTPVETTSCFWAGGGEGEADARGSFNDAGADFEEPEAERGGLGGGQRMDLRNGVSQREEQPVGGGMEAAVCRDGLWRNARATGGQS